MSKTYYLYILTNYTNTVFYIGVTNDLKRRIYEHRNKLVDGFSREYNLKKLVYFDSNNDINSVILREKQMKKWKRAWKINLIRENNPSFQDLSHDWFEESDSALNAE
jgi:putative endonuclease